MSIKFLVLRGGGGVFWVWGGGGESRFYFYGRADFSEICGFSSDLYPKVTFESIFRVSEFFRGFGWSVVLHIKKKTHTHTKNQRAPSIKI